jgi:hypothetical protein
MQFTKLFSHCVPLTILIALASCKPSQEHTSTTTDSAQHAAIIDTVASDSAQRGGVVAKDAQYAARVSGTLQRYIETVLPGYSIPAFARFPSARTMFEVQPEHGYGPTLWGDWNCDSLVDYALVLESPAHRVNPWVFMAAGKTFTKDTIGFGLSLPDTDAPIGYDLWFAEPGPHKHLDLDNPKAGPVTIPCQAIQIRIPEKSARTWYLKGGKWAFLQSSD